MLSLNPSSLLLILMLALNNSAISDDGCCGGDDPQLIGIKEPGSGRYGPYINTSLQPAHAYSPYSPQDSQYLRGALPDTPKIPYDDSKILIKFSSGFAKGNFWDKFKHEAIAEIKPMFPKRDVQKMAGAIPGEKPGVDLWRWTEAVVEHPVDVEELVKELNALPEIQYAQVDYEYKLAVPDGSPNLDAKIQDLPGSDTDPKYGEMWHLEKIKEDVPWAEYSAPLKVKELWQELEKRKLPPGGSPDVVIAVIDTGVDYNHPDLKQNMWINGGEIAGNGIDDDANGFVDDIHGVNVVSDERFHSGDPADDHGHGTHVAGIAAAAGHNKIGVVGVAYSSKIMAIKAAQYSGNLTSSDISEALYYAIQHGADVINMSFAQRVRSPIVEDALTVAFRNAVLVAAAGNYDKALDPGICQPHGGFRNYSLTPFYPAAYNWVIGVEARALKSWGYKPGRTRPRWHTRFTNFDCARNSKFEYEVRAPGDNIWSTFPGKQQYVSWDGTSMAAPMISGIAALLRTAWPDKAKINSRFIMGQISSTAHIRDGVYDKTPEVLDRLKGQPYYGVPDAFASLTEVPKPELYLLDYWIFDKPEVSSINDDDGRVDSGETIDLAIELKNAWGKADEITLSMTAQAKGAAGPDPYVEIITKKVSYSPMGPFSRSDNGLIYDKEGKITGVRNPVRFKVSPDCPNDHLIPITLTLTSKNGLGPKDGFSEDTNTYTYVQRFSVYVQRGKEVPRVISRDTTLTKDFFWIINRQTLIEAGKTLTVNPGTQIQWGAPNVKKVYEWDFSAQLQAEGTFLVKGTAEEPVELFPSEFHECYTMMYGNLKMSHVKITNPYMAGMDVKSAKANGFPTDSDSYIDHGLIRENNICFWRWIEMPRISNTLIDYKMGEFIAPQGLKLGMRYNEAFRHWFWAQNIQGSVFEHGRGPFGTDARNTCRGVTYGTRPPSKVQDTVFLQNHIRDEFGLSSIYWFNANSYKKGEFANLLVTDSAMADGEGKKAPFIENLVSHGGKTYGVVNAKMWSDPQRNGFYQLQVAQSAAKHYKGNVLTINDKAENDFILNYIDKYYPGQKLGIGLNDITSEGLFAWSSGEASAYRNWFPGDKNIKYTGDVISPWPWSLAEGETDSVVDFTGASDYEKNRLTDDNVNSRYRSGRRGIAEFVVNLSRTAQPQQFKIYTAHDRNSDPTSYELYGKTDYKVPGDENAIFSEDFEGLTLGARVDEPKTVDEIVAPLGNIAIREYHNLNGHGIDYLKDSGKLISSNPNFPKAIQSGKADFEGTATKLEWPPGSDPDDPSSIPNAYSSGRDMYGWQAVGYLHPPETGDYMFHLASDDNSELWLSTDDSPNEAKLIAHNRGSSSLRSYVTSGDRASDLINLEKGKRYYIEVIVKENYGGDHMAVAWTIPGGSAPGYRGAPIPGKYLQPWTEKLENYIAYKDGEKVWTKTGPEGWKIDDTAVPGAGNPDKDGVTEWAGWSFPSKEFWAGAGGGLRGGFSKGINNIAVADGDAWADDPNREHAPVAKKISDISVYMDHDSPLEVDLSNVFTDEDPEDADSAIVKSILSNSDESVAKSKLTGDTLTVDIQKGGRGESLITVKGDSDGLSALATVKVVIQDRAPYVANRPKNITVNHSSSDTTVDLSNTFVDSENDPIVLTIHRNSNDTVVKASIDGTNLLLDYLPGKAGEGYVQIKATANGLSRYTEQYFYVVDTAPESAKKLPSLNVKSVSTVSSVDLTGLFSDAEGDPIALSVASNSNEQLLGASIEGNSLKLNYKEGVFGEASVVIRGTANNKTVDYPLAISRGVPFIANPIQDQRFDTSSAPQTIDLSSLFKSADEQEIEKSISVNSNTDLVTATIVDGNLSLEFKPDARGFTTIGIKGGTGGPTVEAQFKVKVGPATGTITIREYHGISGTSISQIKNSDRLVSPNPNFPNAIAKGDPSFEGVATKFEWPPGADPDDPNSVPPGHVRNNYGWQAIGYLHPPETGQYQFYLATDDNSELYLSTDETPANAKLIAVESSWSGVRRYNRSSSAIQLEAGKRYYMEIIAKEGGGGDNMAVAWKTPGGTRPGNGSAPIPGKYLEPWDNQVSDKQIPLITLESTAGQLPPLFAQNFDSLELGPFVSSSESGGDGTDWTATPPTGWVTATGEGHGATAGGNTVKEFDGWTFVDPVTWNATAGQERSKFTKGSGVIAVADSDEFDDGADAKFNASLSTPAIDISSAGAGLLVLTYDSSWRQAPQNGKVTVAFDGGAAVTLLELNADTPTAYSETISLNLNNPAGAQTAVISWEKQGHNDWWWAIDNIEINGGVVITHEAGNAYVDEGASAIDETDGIITRNIVVSNPVDPNKLGEYVVTYNVQDASGNLAREVTRTVKVVDTTPPAITLNGDATVKLEVGVSYSDSGASASDSLEGNLDVKIKQTGKVDTNKIGEYVISYNVTDSSGNAASTVTRTVIVGDTGAPVISLNGLATITHEAGAPYEDQGATALDTGDGDISSKINAASNVNAAVPGTYTVTYSVSDAQGNAAAEVTRTVTVSDTTDPTIILNGEANVVIEVGQEYSDAGASASDSVDGDLSQSIKTSNPVNIEVAGVYTLIYNVSDKAGNVADQVTRTVKVEPKKVEKIQLAVVSYEPAKDAASVDLTKPITINFNKEITQGSGLIVLNYFTPESDQKGTPTSINIGDAEQVLLTGSSITITPKSGTLMPGLKNTLHIENGAIQDLEGAAFEGIAENDYVFTASTIKPGIPSGVVADAADGKVTVTWVAPVSDGGSAISSYTIIAEPRFEGGQRLTGQWNEGDGGLSQELEGLENGKEYIFKVTATNAVGGSEESKPSEVVTPLARVWHWAHPEYANNSNTPVGKASSGIFPVAMSDSSGNLMVTWESDAGVNGNVRTAAGSWSSPVSKEQFLGAKIGSFKEYNTAQDATGAFLAGIKSDEETKKDILHFTKATAPGYKWGESESLSSIDADAASPRIATDGNGNIAVMWHESGKMKLALKLSSSEKWSINTVSPEGATGANPTLDIDGAGNAIAAWQVFKDNHSQIVVSYLPVGADLTKVQSAFISKPSGNSYFPLIKFDKDGNALAIWRWSDGKNYRIQVSYRAKGEDSKWSEPVDISDEGYDADHLTRERTGSPIGFDSAGNAQVVWTLNNKAVYQIQTSSLKAGSNTWSAPVTVSQHVDSEGRLNPLTNAQLPSIAVDADGIGTIAWQQVAPTGVSQIMVSRQLSQDQSWSKPELLSRHEDHAFHPIVVSGGGEKGNPVVVWVQKLSDKLFSGSIESGLREISIAEWSYGVPGVSGANRFVPASDIWPVASSDTSSMKHFDQFGGDFYMGGVLYNGFSLPQDGPNAVSKKGVLKENALVSNFGSSSWTFFGNQGELVNATLTLPEAGFDPDIVILGPSNELVSVNLGGGSKLNYSLHTILPYTGEYTLVVYNPEPFEKYDLFFSRGKNGIKTAGSIKMFGTNEWEFEGQAGDSVYLSMQGKFFKESEGVDVTGGNAISSCIIKLIDPSGTVVAESKSIDYLAMCHATLAVDGTYKVECSAYSNDLGGYELGLFSSNSQSSLVRTVQQPGIVKGSIILGEEKSGQLLPKETATWTFDAAEGDQIVLSSTGMDTVLSLYDPEKTLIEEHDDRNRFNKSSLIRINGLKKSGTYTLVVGSSVSSKGGEYKLSLAKPQFNFKTTVADSGNSGQEGDEKPDPIKVNVIVLTADKSLATIPVNEASWGSWPNSLIDDLNVHYGALASWSTPPEFELSNYTILHSEKVEFASAFDAAYDFTDHPFAEGGAINLFFVGLPDANRGITFLDQRLHRKNGPVVLFNNDLTRSSLVHVHEVGHVFGIEHVAGEGVGASREYVTLNGPPIRYQAYTHSNLESNLMGSWPSDGDISHNGTMSTTMYRQTFSDIFAAWLKWNEVEKAEQEKGTGDGTGEEPKDNKAPVLADLPDVTTDAGGESVVTVEFTDENQTDFHTISVTPIGDNWVTWGVKVLGEGNTSGSKFVLTSEKNSSGTIPIRVEVNDGSIKVSKEFNFTINVPKPVLGEAYQYLDPDSVAENKLKVAVLMVDSAGGKTMFPGWPSTFNEYIAPSTLGDLLFKSKNGLNAFLQEASYGRNSLEGSVIGWGVFDSASEGEAFDSLKGQKKVQAAVTLHEHHTQADLSDFDVIVVYTREGVSGSRSSHSKAGVDDQIEVNGKSSALKWVLFENTTLEQDNGDIPSGSDMVLPATSWAVEFLEQMGIEGSAMALYSDSADAESAVVHSLPDGANPFSIMGAPQWAAHPDLGMKISLGWLKQGEYSEVKADGTHRISALESKLQSGDQESSSDYKGAVIELPFPYTFTSKSGTKFETQRLFVEYRDGIGFDGPLKSKLEDAGQLKPYTSLETVNRRGLLVYAAYPENIGTQSTVLLDMHPSTPLTEDAAKNSLYRAFGELSDAFLNLEEVFTIGNGETGENEKKVVLKVTSIATDFTWIEFNVTGIGTDVGGEASTGGAEPDNPEPKPAPELVNDQKESRRTIGKKGGTSSSGGMNTLLATREIDIQANEESTLWLKFDHAWIPAGNQKAIIKVSYDQGEQVEVVRYESNSESSSYKKNAVDETVTLPLSNPAGSKNMQIHFEYRDAGDDSFWAVDNIRVVAGNSYKGKTLEYKAGDYYALISKGDIKDFVSNQEGQTITFVNNNSYSSYYFRFPTAKNQNNHIEISELEIITDDVTKGTGGPEPSGRPPINDETFDKIDDYHMVAIDGSGGKHGAGGGGYWHNLSFEAQKNIDKKFILELPGDLDLKKFETGLPEIYQSFVSDLNNMKNNAFLTRLWDTDLERFMRFYNMGGRNEVVSFSDNYWGTDSPILVGAMIYDFNEDFNRGPIFYEPVLKSASPKMYPFVEDITITTDSITDQSLRSGAPKQVSTERVKFTLKYNRPMDSNIDPKVHFGPAPPYTDNTVFAVDGGWQNSKEWTGEFSINPGSGDGFQMMHVYGGAAADDAWLVPARDEGRFRFQILSVGAASLTLKVVGHEGYNDVNWLQDDFETLAGYNLYRSETESGEYKRINDSLISIKTNRFIDSNVQPGKKYFYKFTVVQTDQRESNFSNSSSAVPKDTISPVIIHESRKTATANMPLTLFAEVSDNVFVQSVNLLYRRIGNSDFKSIQMKNTTGQRYSASIVASDVVLPGVEYYIEASDGVGTSSSGLALSPYKVEAIDTPFITSTTPIIGPGTGGTTITITGGNFVPETVVYFGDELATDVVVDGRTKITCKTPKHFADTVNILVENPGLKQFSLPRGFTFESTEARVRIPNQIAPQFARVVVPIRASNISGLTAADFKVDYDPYVLTPVDISTGEKFSGWNLASNIDSLSDLKYKLVNHITFDETFMDSSGRGNHAFRDINYDNWSFTSEKGGIFTKVIEGQKYSFGNLDFVTGKVGTHAIGGNFRTTDYVSLGRPDDLNLSQDIDFSLSLWLKTTGTILESTAPAIFSNDYLTLRTLKSKGQGDVTSVDWVLVGANGGRASGETKAGPNIDDHEWHHIAFIYDRSNKVYTYVDGKKVGEWDVPDKLDITTPLDGAFNLGQVGSGNQSNSLKVHFDDLALWRRAINAKEVETIYASGNEGLDISGAGGALQHKEAKTLSVSLASNGGSFTGSGNLVNVEFLVIGKAGTQSPLYASGITVREFTGIGGSKVRNLVSSPKFPDKPDLTAKALYTEWPPGDASGGLPPDRYKDNYGVQMLGYIHPPETGEYIFYISSDDNGELYLSTDENPANKKLIATEPHWNNRREWVSEWNRYKVGPRVDNDQWHQMAFTRKKGGDVSVYFDGKKVGTSSAQHLVNLNNADLELMLNQDGTGDYYAHAAASYDDVGIWARELSQQDIEKLYNQGKQGSSLNSDTVGLKDSLVAHLGFDDKLDDSTGNANNGILANTAVDVSSPLNDILATSDNSPNGETVEFAIDDNPGTKYLNFDKLNAGLTITLDEASSLTGLGFISANDVPARDPASYKLTGSNDGVTFETVSEGSVPDFFERFQRREIKFDAKSKAYSTYRLIFPTVVDASSANSVQIAEVQFLGAESSANYIPGKIGSKAIKFGHGEYMKFGKDGKGIDFSESFSVSLWVKTNGWQDDPAIISNKNWNDGWNQGWVLAFTDDGSFKFNANELENSSRIDISAQTSRNANQSEPVRLEKGKAYYIEALMKEGGGGDNLAVTWQMPGDPKPTNRTTKPISGTHLSPWSLDEEGNPITPSQLKNKELSTNIKLSKALLNEGRINVAINDGSLQVQGGTSISGKIYHWKTLAQVRNTTVRLNVGGFDDQGYFSKLLDIKNTGDTGAYGFSDIESIVLDPNNPNKKYYIISPSKEDQAFGISAYDAALVQAHMTGNLKIGLDQNELLAADVTNNGSVTSQDAFYILEHSVGLRPVPFPGAGRIWMFRESQIIMNEFLSTKLGQDFKAILIGDVSGNWIGNESLGGRISGPIVQPQSLASVNAGLMSVHDLQNEEQVHRLVIQSGEKKIYGVNLQLSYDESKHTKFEIDSDYAIAVNENIPGIILVGVASGQGLKGDRILLSVRAKGQGKENLWLDSIVVNEGMYQAKFEATMGSLDADSDGLMDIDESEVFHTRSDTKDSDGDRMNDGDEVYAGTDPLDSESALRISFEENDGIFLLNWDSILGIGYTVETTPDLSGKWIKYGDTRWSTGDTMTIPIDPPEKLEQSFYRVKVNE